MAQGQNIQLEAAIRYYGDETNTVHLVNPALITDFTTVEKFNFDIPHTIFKIKDGAKAEVPIQVFGISENREELLNPERRRVFEKKRKSDVMAEIVATREKREIEEKNKSKLAKQKEKESPLLSKQAHVPAAKNHSKAQDLKAIEKKIKEDAKNYSKATDKEILTMKLNKMQEQKLNYDDDCSALEKKQKEINDLQTLNILKAQEIAEMKRKHEEEIEIFKAKLQKKNEVLLKSRDIIKNFQSISKSAIAEPNVSADSLEEIQEESVTLETFTSSHSKGPSSPNLELNNSDLPCANNSQSLGEYAGDMSLGQGHDTDNHQVNPKTIQKFGDSTDKSEDGSKGVKDKSIINAEEMGDMADINFEMNLPGSSQSSRAVAAKNRNNESDEEDAYFNKVLTQNTITIEKLTSESLLHKKKLSGDSDKRDYSASKSYKTKSFEKVRGQTFRRKKKVTDDVRSDDSEKENQKITKAKKQKRRIDSSSDEENVGKGAIKKGDSKKPNNRLTRTKKYKQMDSSDSDSDSNKEKKRKRYTRASDDDYQSDLMNESDRQNYKSYHEKDGKKRHMMHLKYDISIRYKWWEEMKKEFDMKEWIRLLLHAMFKEEDLIDKVFKIGLCKTERLPGRKRTVFTLEEKAVIRSTFFCRVDKVVRSRKEARLHKDHWKTYISEHINSLIEAEKKILQRRQAAERKKKKAMQDAAHQKSSLSSEDA